MGFAPLDHWFGIWQPHVTHSSSFISVVTSHYIQTYLHSKLPCVQVGPLLSVSRNTWRSQKVHLHLKGLAKFFSYSWNVRGAESSQISWAIFMWSQEAQRCPGWLLCHPSSSSLEAGCVFWHSIGAALCFPEVPLCHPGGGNLSLLSCTLWLEVLNTQCMYNESLQQVASKTIFSKQYFKQ